METFLEISVYFIAIVVGYITAIPIHELGHLIFGKLTGYSFASYRVSKFLWAKDSNGKIKFTKGSSVGVAGQCLMRPVDDEKDFRYFLYNAGGGLLNVILGLPMVIFALISKDVSAYVDFIFLGIGIMWVYIGGFLNLFPNTQIIPNDGANIREAKKSKDARKAFYLMLKVNFEQQTGKFTETYPEDMFLLPENADLKNYLVVSTVSLRSEQLQNLGRYEEAAELTSKIVVNNDVLKKLPMFYGVSFVLDYAFVQAVNLKDPEKARKAIENYKSLSKNHDKLFNRLLKLKMPNFLIANAMIAAILENDKEKANSIIAELRTQISALQNPGAEHSLSLMVSSLAGGG